MVTADQALAAAAHGLVVLSAEQQANDSPETREQLEAVFDAAALIARDVTDPR
ncbi:hypothetical protein [Streptomyces flavochromogenes]|uniref:hypothetical protein n=1 Tax=Streptomyces flavochromogenes TaxID=68199 RepID=UPI000B1B6562|nr:hypothetical protein [Streptomyces flavochromogenes]